MNIQVLPTKGKMYSSGEAITEFNVLIEQVMSFRKSRCDCDSSSRCTWCIMEQELNYRKEVLKKKIADFITAIESSKTKS